MSLSDVFRRLEELERRQAQMIVRGKVAEVDPVAQRARVSYGDNQITGWLPWKPLRAGKAIVWWAPEVGEGVTVLSSGDLSLGEILPGSYHSEFPAPADDPELFLVQFGDGSKVSHHRDTGLLDVVNVGDVVITCRQNVTLNATGSVAVNSDAKDIKLNNGKGVVQGDCICKYDGLPHSDVSSQVTAGK